MSVSELGVTYMYYPVLMTYGAIIKLRHWTHGVVQANCHYLFSVREKKQVDLLNVYAGLESFPWLVWALTRLNTDLIGEYFDEYSKPLHQ